jgi:glycosyltransferase involved in cell wall biosynthesis
VTPRVSVVVPTYRRPALLGRCLQALAAQTVDPEEYEVIVVDDAGDADTRVNRRAIRGARLSLYAN